MTDTSGEPPGGDEPHRIEHTIFARLLAGPLKDAITAPGDYVPLDTSVSQSLVAANCFIRLAQENTVDLCKILRVSRNSDWPWSNPALLPDEEAFVAISKQVRSPEVVLAASALWDLRTAVDQDPGDPEALGAAALLLLGAACSSAFEPSSAVVALHALNVVCLRLAQCPQGGPPPPDDVVPADATKTPNVPEAAGCSDVAGLQAGSSGWGDASGIPPMPPAPYAPSMQPPPPLATTGDASASQPSLDDRSEECELAGTDQGDRFGAPLTADGDGITEAQGTRLVVSVGAAQDGALGPPFFGEDGGSGNALADVKFRVCSLVAHAIMKQLKLAAMGKLRPDVQELGTQLCACLSAFVQRECYRYQHHADIIFREVRAHVVQKILEADATKRNLSNGAAKLVAVLLGLEAPQDGLKYSTTFMQLGVGSLILLLVAELKTQPAPMAEEVRMHNYAHGEAVLSALSLLFQNSMAHGVLEPQERLKDVLTILEQVAPEVVATAQREKCLTDAKQPGDTSKLVNPQKQAAEAMRQTAELAKQLRRSTPEPRFLAQALYVVHMIALHCPSVLEAANACSWPKEGFAALFKFLTRGVDPAVQQAAAGAISVILSQHIQRPFINKLILAGSVKLKGSIDAFDAVKGNQSKNMADVRQSIAFMIRTLSYDPAGSALPEFLLRPNSVISWLVEGMSDRTTHWSTRAEFAATLGNLAQTPWSTLSQMKSKGRLAAKDFLTKPKAAIRTMGGLPAMITLLFDILQSARKPLQTDDMAKTAMLSVVSHGITRIKDDEDIGTIMKDGLLPLLLQIMDAENMLDADATLVNASLVAWGLNNKAFQMEGSTLEEETVMVSKAKKACQDEVVKLKGHETLTKLLIWLSENEPKPDPPDLAPPKMTRDMMTHLETVNTIANVLHHAILSDYAAAHYLDGANALQVLFQYFEKAKALTVGSYTWYSGSKSAQCLGDCHDILKLKYRVLAKQTLRTCLQTLADIVVFAKGPKQDKTICDRLRFATSSMAMLACNLQPVDPKYIKESSSCFQALLDLKHTLRLEGHTINSLSKCLTLHRDLTKENAVAEEARVALLKEEAEKKATAAAKASAKHDKAEKVRIKRAAEEEEKTRIQEEEERARREAEELQCKRAAEERLRAQEEETRIADARQERLEQANLERQRHEEARMAEEAEQKRRDEAKRALEAAEAAAQELAASKARAEAAEKAAEAEAIRKAQEAEAGSKVEAARAPAAAAAMAGSTAGAAALSSGAPPLLSKTSAEGRALEEPVSGEERCTEGDQPVSNTSGDGLNAEASEGNVTPEGINISIQHTASNPPASMAALPGAAPGSVPVAGYPWGNGAHQAPAPPPPPPALPAVNPGPPATDGAAALSTADQRIEGVFGAHHGGGFQRAVGGEQVLSPIPGSSAPSNARPASPPCAPLDTLPGLLFPLLPPPAP